MSSAQIYRDVAKLHINSINNGFLATLGIDLLALLYRAIDESQSSVLIVKEKSGSVIGFVAGTTSMMSVYHQLFRHPVKLFCGLITIVWRPRKIWKIVEILIYSKKKKLPNNDSVDAELLSIAVSPEFRGEGVADELYGKLSSLYEQGFIIVVGESLIPAQKFYKKMGAKEIGRVSVHGSERSVIFLQKVSH